MATDKPVHLLIRTARAVDTTGRRRLGGGAAAWETAAALLVPEFVLFAARAGLLPTVTTASFERGCLCRRGIDKAHGKGSYKDDCGEKSHFSEVGVGRRGVRGVVKGG